MTNIAGPPARRLGIILSVQYVPATPANSDTLRAGAVLNALKDRPHLLYVRRDPTSFNRWTLHRSAGSSPSYARGRWRSCPCSGGPTSRSISETVATALEPPHRPGKAGRLVREHALRSGGHRRDATAWPRHRNQDSAEKAADLIRVKCRRLEPYRARRQWARAGSCGGQLPERRIALTSRSSWMCWMGG